VPACFEVCILRSKHDFVESEEVPAAGSMISQKRFACPRSVAGIRAQCADRKRPLIMNFLPSLSLIFGSVFELKLLPAEVPQAEYQDICSNHLHRTIEGEPTAAIC
jgi:hypothetical protein